MMYTVYHTQINKAIGKTDFIAGIAQGGGDSRMELEVGQCRVVVVWVGRFIIIYYYDRPELENRKSEQISITYIKDIITERVICVSGIRIK